MCSSYYEQKQGQRYYNVLFPNLDSLFPLGVIDHVPVDDNPAYITMKRITLNKNTAYETGINETINTSAVYETVL